LAHEASFDVFARSVAGAAAKPVDAGLGPVEPIADMRTPYNNAGYFASIAAKGPATPARHGGGLAPSERRST
jgi:hypothetical protein